MKPTASTLFIVVTALIIAGGAYWYFFRVLPNEDPISIGTTQNETQVQFQILVTQLDPISFNDTSVFSDSRFTALVDLTTPIAPEPLGRTDPFAPLGGASATQ